jgi:hypothetical protein|tara:strand:+ start:1380 stop:1628 length:249 start_codon:yes stop_codon:yes gene_type:complete
MLNFNLFKNDRKLEGDNQPLYKNATVVVDEDIILKAGQKYEIALWKKDKTKDGRDADFLSVSVKENNFSINTEVEETDKPPF